MDKHRAWTFVLVLIMVYSNSVSGSPLMPNHLKVSICDEQVTLAWDPAVDTASEARYSVQMSNLHDNWTDVSKCTKIPMTYCDLTNHIPEFWTGYRIRVHTITANGVSKWAVKNKILINEEGVCPPAFTLSATSSSLTVRVDTKPLLRKLFPYGITYTVYLEERGKGNETKAYLNHDNMEISEESTQTFRSLHGGGEYCVRLCLQSNTADHISNMSAPQCCRLPEVRDFMLTLTWLSTLGVLIVLAVIVCVCSFVRRPEKMPVALKCPKTGWSPLTVEEGPMEVVTDKGWFLSAPKAMDKNRWVNKEPHAGEQEAEWKSERRTSLDSGVSLGSNGPAKTESGSDPASICASTESSQDTGSFSSGVEEHHPQDRRTQAPSTEGKPVDLGVCGLKGNNKLYSLSSSEGQDSGFIPEGPHLIMDQYQRKRSPSLQALKEIRNDPDAAPAFGITGYRKGSLWCTWQTNHGPWPRGPEEAGGCGDGSAELSEGALTFSTNYRRKIHVEMETVVSVDDSESPCDWPDVSLEEAHPPMFLPLTVLPVVSQGDTLGCVLNMVSISLCDVEVWNE